MMAAAGKEDLGLSLSLSFPHHHHHDNNHLQLNLTPNTTTLFPSPFNLSKISWNQAPFPFSDHGNSEICIVENRSILKGIDVNRFPSTAADCDEEDAGVSSPNSTISSVSGKRSSSDREAAAIGDDYRDSSCRGGIISDEEDGDTSRKKLRLSKDQSAVLEDSFKDHSTLNPKQKMALAKRLGLRPRQVEVWFQNRRARTKLKQTEVDCEYLKRCCENLTEENRRLQKEVQELRALKLSPQFYMQMSPPTTLTMCPSCERVAVPSPSSSSAAPPVSVHHRSHHPMNPWATTSIHDRSYRHQ